MSRRRLIAELVETTTLATTLAAVMSAGGAAASDDLAVVSRAEALPIDVIGARVETDARAQPAYTILASVDQDSDPGPRAVFEKPATGAAAAEEDEDVLFEADFVAQEDEDSPIIAEGNVRAFFGKRYLHADRLSYDPKADIVIAEGNVSITDTTGKTKETAFAGRVELTGDLRDGIAENFSALLAENAKIAADSAVQEQGARTRLKKAVYTSCDVCKENGKGKTPTWRVKALRVTRDRERRVVRFHHAFLELMGVPVLYAPFLQGPDPSVERQSGFLAPFFGTSSRLGFNVEIPYYLAISDHQDATFYPKYTTKDGVVWQGEYRRRDVSGGHVIQASVLNFDNTKPDEAGNLPIDVPGVRWHFFARGNRDFGDDWSVGYDIERVSDDTYLRRYNIERRGDLRKEIDTSNTNRLRSNTWVKWASGGSELTADAYLFQGLRALDIAAKTPYVLPLLNFRHDVAQPILGGQAQLGANFAWLQRASGVDSQRLTLSALWNREHITANGHRFNAFAEVRGDAYYFHDLQEGTEILAGDPTDRRDIDGRFAPSVGLEWSYPLTRRFAGARLLVEPRVQLIASPSNRNPADIINEDSQSIEFDFAGLFDYNKSTGFDRFEDGQRMNVGVTASAEFDNGIVIEGAVGAQGRLQNSNAFDASTGLGEKRSDFVGEINVRYKDYIAIENRFRVDDDDGSVQRAETLATFNIWRFSGSASYVRLSEENIAAELVRREELMGAMRVKLTRNWATGFSWREDLEQKRTISQDFLIGYVDECSSFDIIYRRDFTRDVGLGPDDSIFIRFTLKSLVD